MRTFPLPADQDPARYNNYRAGSVTVYEYGEQGGGEVVQTVKASDPANVGLRYGMGATVQATMVTHSEAWGAVYVQTRKPTGGFGRYYFDNEAFVVRGADDSIRGNWLTQEQLLDPGNDVIVGSEWALTPGEAVDAVVFTRPSNGNLYGNATKGDPGMTAPTLRGRGLLDRFKGHYAGTKPR